MYTIALHDGVTLNTIKREMQKLDILAFGAHPDDVELGCGGTLLSAVAQGKKVGIIDLTKGELGTRGNSSQRLKEAQLASQIIGAAVRENLGMPDGFFENNKENQFAIIEIIRCYQPTIILCNAVDDRHCTCSTVGGDSFIFSGFGKNTKYAQWPSANSLETQPSFSLYTIKIIST